MRKGKEDNKKASASAHFSTRTRGVSVASQHAACLLTVRDECGKASVRHQFWTVLVTGDLCWHAFTYFSLVDSFEQQTPKVDPALGRQRSHRSGDLHGANE